jgi:hypothetical protein
LVIGVLVQRWAAKSRPTCSASPARIAGRGIEFGIRSRAARLIHLL